MKLYPKMALMVEATIMAFFGFSLLLSPIRVESVGVPSGIAAFGASGFLFVLSVIFSVTEDWFSSLSPRVKSVLGVVLGILVGTAILFAVSEIKNEDVGEGALLVRTILLIFPILWTGLFMWNKAGITLVVGVILVFLYVFKGTSVVNEWTCILLLAYILWGDTIISNFEGKGNRVTGTSPRKNRLKPVIKIIEEVFRPGMLNVLGWEMIIWGTFYFSVIAWKTLLVPPEMKMIDLVYPSCVIAGGFVTRILANNNRFKTFREQTKIVCAFFLFGLLSFGLSSLALTPALLLILVVCGYWLVLGWYVRFPKVSFSDQLGFATALLGSVLLLIAALVIALSFIWPVILFLCLIGCGCLAVGTIEIVR